MLCAILIGIAFSARADYDLIRDGIYYITTYEDPDLDDYIYYDGPHTTFPYDENGNWMFGDPNDGTVGVTSGDTKYTGYVSIPYYVNLSSLWDFYATVTSIENMAFKNCTGLTGVSIPSSIKRIGYDAFYGCTGLTSVSIPNSVTIIDGSAFSCCYNLRNVNIPNAVITLGTYAFAYCIMTSVSIPSTTTSISGNTFLGCDQLSSMTVASGNTVYDSRNSCNAIIKTSSNSLIAGCKNTIIPNTVTSIGESAFSYHSGLTSLNIPNSVASISGYAFYNCTGLASLTIGSGVTGMGSYAFTSCNSLTDVTCLAMTPPSIQSNTFQSSHYSNVTLRVPGPWALSKYKAANYWKNFTNIVAIHPDYDFYENGVYYLITSNNTCKVTYKDTDYNSYTGIVTIPSTVSYGGTTYRVIEIGESAFRGSTGLSRVYIGSNVTVIGLSAFYKCSNLTTIGIPAGVTTIGSSAFTYTALSNVIIPNSVTTIGWNAFGDISTLTSVIIGSGCTSMGAYAFDSPLTKVTCLAPTPPVISNDNCFKSTTYNSAPLYVPAASVNAYKAANGWKNFQSVQGLPTLDNALNVSGGTIHFIQDETTYPWMVLAENGRTFAQSSNAGVSNSTSKLSATITLTKASTVSFDYKAWGEGVSYDECYFFVDGTEKFAYGAIQNNWENYTVNLPAGNHTLSWVYSKDSTVNPEGDYFAIDNVKISLSAVRGDVDGDGNVSISDMTKLIDYLLTPGSNTPANGDVNGDTNVTIADVTALIEYLLTGIW